MKSAVLKLLISGCCLIPVAAGLLLAGEDAEAGKAEFMNRCKMCHGADGKGNPSMARILKVEFPHMDSEYIQKKSDAEIREIITEGKGKMAPVRGLKEEQIEHIIAYLRTLAKEQ